MKKTVFFYCILCIFFHFPSNAENDRTGILAEAVSIFEKVDGSGQSLEKLTLSNLQTLPVGLKQTIGNIEFTIAVSSMRLLETHAEMTVFARMKIPQKDKILFFA
ncbi:MAG: hypothetical protein LBU57_00215, partial [Dysgonamonadaceae bacterium]|nr:hypothetical protein [Dysgonamonadaceae bacterium]